MYNPFSRHHRDRPSSQNRSFQRPMEHRDATQFRFGADEDGLSSVGLSLAGLSLRTPYDRGVLSQPHPPPPIHPPMRMVGPTWGNESTAVASDHPGGSSGYYEQFALSYDEEHAATPKPPKPDDLFRKPIDIPQYSEVLARRHAQCRPQWCCWGEESTCTKACPWAQPAAANGPFAPPRSSSAYNPRMDPRIIAGGNYSGWQSQQTQMPVAMPNSYYPRSIPAQTSWFAPSENQTLYGLVRYDLPTTGAAVAYPCWVSVAMPQGVWNNGIAQYPARPCKITADGWPVSDPPPPYRP
ncbi:hypothetical protein C8Q73DRAFT_667670 [Cubamyces lactineus]|nr:hypothetical protein C8Q73DRAFT_667670 [Cubamyces lactineus]